VELDRTPHRTRWLGAGRSTARIHRALYGLLFRQSFAAAGTDAPARGLCLLAAPVAGRQRPPGGTARLLEATTRRRSAPPRVTDRSTTPACAKLRGRSRISRAPRRTLQRAARLEPSTGRYAVYDAARRVQDAALSLQRSIGH